MLIANNAGKFAAQEAYEKNYYEISEMLVDVEVSLKKDEIVQSNVGQNDVDDQIDLDVDIETIECQENKEDLEKLNLNK